MELTMGALSVSNNACTVAAEHNKSSCIDTHFSEVCLHLMLNAAFNPKWLYAWMHQLTVTMPGCLSRIKIDVAAVPIK